MARTTGPRNLHGQVVQELGQMIVGGSLAPGEPLPREEALATRMAVSRTVLREALKVLATKGLIETRQKTGMRVRETRFWNQLDADVLAWRCAAMPTDDFVDKLVEMREIVEPAAAAAAARRRDDEQLAEVAAAYAAMDAAMDLDAWAEADVRFHEAVLRATNNELLGSLFSVIQTALATYFLMSARTTANFRYSLPQHHAVYDAIRRRRPNAAADAMRGLISASRDTLKTRRAVKP